MKKIGLFLVLITSLLACSLEDRENYTEHILPIESFVLPETFVKNKTHEIKIKYQKPTECYNYKKVFYAEESNTGKIAIYANVKNGENCSEIPPPLSDASFDFVPTTAGTYIFKFYKGADDEGKDVFEEVEIVVTE